MQSASSYLLAAVVCASFALSGTAQAQPSIKVASPDGSARLPSAAYSPTARIPQTGKTFDALSSTDYYNYTQEYANPPNPDIAVGPDDMLMVVGQNRIARVPNPNSPGNASTMPFNFASSPTTNWNNLKNSVPTSEVFLDTWLGQPILNDLCPGQFDARTCLVGNPTVRYDQLQGRFVVLFTVIDTGVRGVNNVVTLPRSAHWVLLVSTHAKLIQGVGGTSTVFTPPLPPTDIGGDNTGGLNGDNWMVYYWNAGNLMDINKYSTHPTADPISAPGAYSADFPISDCNVAAIATVDTDPGSVCLFPTSARLGIDNDSLILVSPVVDANHTLANSNAIPGTTGPFWGNRVRVLSKAAVYTGNELTNGNTLVPPTFTPPPPTLPTPTPALTQWDLFRDLPVDALATPNHVYTIGLEYAAADEDLAPLANIIVFEPSHLRGRALAKFSNYPFGGYTELIGDMPWETNPVIFTQQIAYRADYVPSLVGDGAFEIPVNNPVWPPLTVPQMAGCATTPCRAPAEWDIDIGDARFQRAIYREGHVYGARVGQDAPFGSAIVTVGDNEPRSTVFYDVVQTIYDGAIPDVYPGAPDNDPITPINPLEVISAKWQNGHFYAPMFDVTANVIRSGPMSPSYTLPFLEKLFVGTTSPRLLGPDTTDQYNVWPSLFDIRQGLDRYDREVAVRDPRTGIYNMLNVFGQRGGAATDPNAGGLWTFGAFSNYRLDGNVGQWATHAAYYPMSFPSTDVYGTDANYFADVDSTNPFFTEIQTARQLGLTQYLSPAPAVNDPEHGLSDNAPSLDPNALVTRKEMAAFIVYSQMDEAAVDHFLSHTPGGIDGVSFADVGGNVTEAQRKAIEVMWRRGYTRGCGQTNDGLLRFCPDSTTSRGEMAVFIIRAKMNNVFPTVVSGCNTTVPLDECSTDGDNFGLFLEDSYFTDVPSTDDFYIYIQKLRELRITNGYGSGAFGRNDPITRGQMITFVVRAFHY